MVSFVTSIKYGWKLREMIAKNSLAQILGKLAYFPTIEDRELGYQCVSSAFISIQLTVIASDFTETSSLVTWIVYSAVFSSQSTVVFLVNRAWRHMNEMCACICNTTYRQKLMSKSASRTYKRTLRIYMHRLAPLRACYSAYRKLAFPLTLTRPGTLFIQLYNKTTIK